MSTIGSMASLQVRMASVAARNNLYGYGSYGYNTSYGKSRTSVNDAMEQILKNKNDYFKQQYNELYKKVLGKYPDGEEGETVENTVSLKTASYGAQNASYSIMKYANSLKYGGEYDTEEAEKEIQNFVDNYNTFIDSLGNSDNQLALQKGVFMVNTAKVYSSALNRAGVTLGSDNKLTFDKEKMSQVDATDIKSTFGSGGFSSKVAQKAQQVYDVAGSSGLFSYSRASSQSYAYTIGALLNMYA